ncbi:MAG: hypothetical protein GY725_18735 [bacterium]|nr:hypothetical protein [bacterium]
MEESTSDTGEAGESEREGPRSAWIWLWVGVFFAFTGGFQLCLPYFFDADTGYHLAVARLIREYGILHAFPWTPYSWLADHYADKELAFHLLLVPLSSLPANVAARAAGTLLGAGLLTVFFAICVRERVRFAGLWTLIVLTSSSAFIWRFSIVRPHLISISLVLILSWAAVRRRWALLFVVSVLYPLCYTAWHLPLILLAIVEAVRWLAEGRIEWRVLALTTLGLALGIALHPNFPETLEFFWVQNIDVLFGTAWAGVSGFELGGEFRPFSPSGMVRYMAWPALLTLGAAVLAWRDRQRDVLPLAIAAIAVAFLVLTLRSQRFIEYLAPFAALAAALAWRPIRWSGLAPGLLCASAIYLALIAPQPIQRMLKRSVLFPGPVAEELQRIVPRDAQVFTCDWHFTGEMMLALPERRFMVALDPVFFWKRDPDLYTLWFDTVHTPPPRPASLIFDSFDARFVVCDRRLRWLPLLKALEEDPRAHRRAIVGYWSVYEIDEVARPSASLTAD